LQISKWVLEHAPFTQIIWSQSLSAEDSLGKHRCPRKYMSRGDRNTETNTSLTRKLLNTSPYFLICKMVVNSPNERTWIRQDNTSSIAHRGSCLLNATFWGVCVASRVGKTKITFIREVADHVEPYNFTYRKCLCWMTKYLQNLTGVSSLCVLTLKDSLLPTSKHKSLSSNPSTTTKSRLSPYPIHTLLSPRSESKRLIFVLF
jgi:hypothetical protein